MQKVREDNDFNNPKNNPLIRIYWVDIITRGLFIKFYNLLRFWTIYQDLLAKNEGLKRNLKLS